MVRQSILMKTKLRNPAGESVLMGPHKKQKQQQQRGGIPMELLESEILKRLPVRSLLRFRAVSKSLKTLIDSNYFIKLHLQHDDINHDDHLVALSTSSIVRTYGIEVVDKSSFTKLFRFTTGIVDEVNKEVALNFIGTCNGLICIHAEYYLETYHRIQHVYLWNPVMGVTKVIDHKVQHWDHEFTEYSTNYGFAYDPENHDYKVVMIEHCCVFNLSTCIAKKVYSLNNSSWKTIDDQSTFSNFFILPQNFEDYTRTPFVHGAIHWVARDWTINSERATIGEGDQVAISFRIGEEVFEEIVLPQPARRRYNNLLVSYKSLLACMVSDSDNVRAASVHLWVMKEYGVSESWTKLYTIDSSGLAPTPPENDVVCIGFGEDENEHVFTVKMTNKVLFWKNYKTSSISQLTTSTSLPATLYDKVDAITFRPSLVKFLTNV